MVEQVRWRGDRRRKIGRAHGRDRLLAERHDHQSFHSGRTIDDVRVELVGIEPRVVDPGCEADFYAGVLLQEGGEPGRQPLRRKLGAQCRRRSLGPRVETTSIPRRISSKARLTWRIRTSPS